MGSKYNSKKTVVDGITFDSKKEANRYCELKLMEKSGLISELILQPRYDVEINGQRICFYKADFSYNDENTNLVVEDVKGCKKGAAYAMFRLKVKLVAACHGIEIVEI